MTSDYTGMPALLPTLRRRFRRIRLLLAGGFTAALLAMQAPAGTVFTAQQPPQQPPPQQQEQTIRVGVELVNLFATVRDGKKRPVANLTEEDFRVFEDGQEQKIEFFSREIGLPITLGMLMDTSISMEGIFGAEQDAASRFLRRVLRPRDMALIITFDVDVDLLSDFSQDHDLLERAIRRARINAPGSPINPGPFPLPPRGTAFYDAVYLACREKLGREVGRKALVVLTDAEDFGSKVKLEDALEAAQRSDTVVHVIHIYDPRFDRGFGGGGEGVARKLADETGGRALFVRNEKDLEKAFDEISEELRTQYQLGYYPTNRSRQGKFRKLKVETKRGGMKVLTRKGYYEAREK